MKFLSTKKRLIISTINLAIAFTVIIVQNHYYSIILVGYIVAWLGVLLITKPSDVATPIKKEAKTK